MKEVITMKGGDESNMREDRTSMIKEEIILIRVEDTIMIKEKENNTSLDLNKLFH